VLKVRCGACGYFDVGIIVWTMLDVCGGFFFFFFFFFFWKVMFGLVSN
jgi:hypothetical protein